jgi:hypothetical protein
VRWNEQVLEFHSPQRALEASFRVLGVLQRTLKVTQRMLEGTQLA